MSGYVQLGMSTDDDLTGIQLTGTGSMLISNKKSNGDPGGYGVMATIAAAPAITLLGGLITINLNAVAAASSSYYFQYNSKTDYTIAYQATIILDPGNFIGGCALAAAHSSPALAVALGAWVFKSALSYLSSVLKVQAASCPFFRG